MSETKASKIIKTLHDNDLATSVLKAAIENDERLFLDTLYYANLDEEDLTLSDAEFDNYVKGIKPSGELDLITWEGYYEVNVGSNLDDPLAFLILSTTEGVYWGSRTQIMSRLEDYAVTYTLTSDGKLNFSTPNNGDVSMTFTRTVDDTTDKLNVTFSAVCGGQIVSGGKVNAPLQLTTTRTLIDPSTGRTLTIRTPLSLLIIKINQSEFARVKDISTRSLSWLDIFSIVGTGLTIATSILPAYIFLRWVKANTYDRVVQSRKTRRQLDEEESIETIQRLTGYRAKHLNVKFDSAGRDITNAITSVINGTDHLGDIDWQKDPDDIIIDLRDTAQTAGRDALYKYVESRIRADISGMLSPFISVSVYETFKEEALDVAVRQRIDPKLRDLGPEAYDLLVRSVILPARQRAFSENYRVHEQAYNGSESAYNNAVQNRKDTANEIELIEQAMADPNLTDAERQQHLERKEELAVELEERKAHENESLQARDEAKRAKDKAAEDSREADRHVQEDRSKEEWDKKLGEVFKK